MACPVPVPSSALYPDLTKERNREQGIVSKTDLDKVSWHFTETGETVPYLPDNDIPDLGFAHSATVCCGYLLSEQSLG